jgi:alanyl-tRNA synthetase
MTRSTGDLRRAFLEYFAKADHEIVASSPLVPGNDPTLLFTNAGMVQFKDVFLGVEKRANPRATSAQRCVRAGGKHNDLENVGYTARHHTFFEMLGNFSFGDYFKQEAIHYAWEFITKDLGLDPARLWCTVYEQDDDAADIWLKDVGIDAKRFSRLGEKDNFWAMGDTGPCGPCSEIFYDHGADIAGGPPGSPGEDGDRYVEIWNLVFMQFDRNAAGDLKPLPKPSVDTGMGLERIAAVMQGVHSNYEIDLFAAIIADVAAVTNADGQDTNSLQVIADHIRACSFLMADGVLPGREGRGYVLRRIIRRAVRHGYKLGMEEPFFHRLVKSVDKQMGDAYPELSAATKHIEQVLKQEELRFAETLSQGMGLLENVITDLNGKVIPGDTAFKLYDTYGFPIDLTADIARERGLSVDESGFAAAMDGQRRQSQAASKFTAQDGGLPHYDGPTRFSGYETLTDDGKVTALFKAGNAVDVLDAGDTGIVVLDTTPFYAESGGQVGDQGQLVLANGEFRVDDTRKLSSANGHLGVLETGQLQIGDSVTAQVDAKRRNAIVLNHSATHLMHAALREVLGDHVQQKGSLVAPDRLRFDFSHYQALTTEELARIESLVNDEIRRNAIADTQEMPFQAAVDAGAMAFFGDKYGDTVRVLKIGDFSIELCGGLHVKRAGDIGLFKITVETGIAAGVRRIEAVTGEGALAQVRDTDALLRTVADLVKGSRDDLDSKVASLVERNRGLEKEVQALKGQLASGGARDLFQEVVEVGGVKVLAARLDGADQKALRDAADKMKDKLRSGVVILGAVEADKVRLVAGVTPDLTDRLKAGELIRPVAESVGGRGGGRADMAQAGGSQPENLDAALAAVAGQVAQALE